MPTWQIARGREREVGFHAESGGNSPQLVADASSGGTGQSCVYGRGEPGGYTWREKTARGMGLCLLESRLITGPIMGEGRSAGTSLAAAPPVLSAHHTGMVR